MIGLFSHVPERCMWEVREHCVPPCGVHLWHSSTPSEHPAELYVEVTTFHLSLTNYPQRGHASEERETEKEKCAFIFCFLSATQTCFLSLSLSDSYSSLLTWYKTLHCQSIMNIGLYENTFRHVNSYIYILLDKKKGRIQIFMQEKDNKSSRLLSKTYVICRIKTYAHPVFVFCCVFVFH